MQRVTLTGEVIQLLAERVQPTQEVRIKQLQDGTLKFEGIGAACSYTVEHLRQQAEKWRRE
jgi:predicted metalloprotease